MKAPLWFNTFEKRHFPELEKNRVRLKMCFRIKTPPGTDQTRKILGNLRNKKEKRKTIIILSRVSPSSLERSLLLISCRNSPRRRQIYVRRYYFIGRDKFGGSTNTHPRSWQFVRVFPHTRAPRLAYSCLRAIANTL